MELLDVLTDIATPDNSDVKGEEVEELTMPAVMQALLNVQTYPTRWTPYMELYQCQVYKAKADKKVRKMKNLIKRCALAELKTLVRAVILFVHNQAYLSQRSVVLK